MFFLIFFSAPSFFRHQKDSGVWSVYKGKNLFLENHILTFLGLGIIKIKTVSDNFDNPRPSLILNN